MKPLELTIYPHSPKHFNSNWLSFYITPEGLMAAGQGGIIPASKRLTDAELAAERWHAQSEYLQEATLATTTSLALPRIGALMEMQAVAATLLRFATTPHYFEEAA